MAEFNATDGVRGGMIGSMPPGMGSWQPERLRYGAATKNRRVADKDVSYEMERYPEDKTRRVTGDDEANRLLLRPYRNPWVHPTPGNV